MRKTEKHHHSSDDRRVQPDALEGIFPGSTGLRLPLVIISTHTHTHTLVIHFLYMGWNEQLTLVHMFSVLNYCYERIPKYMCVSAKARYLSYFEGWIVNFYNLRFYFLISSSFTVPFRCMCFLFLFIYLDWRATLEQVYYQGQPFIFVSINFFF